MLDVGELMRVMSTHMHAKKGRVMTDYNVINNEDMKQLKEWESHLVTVNGGTVPGYLVSIVQSIKIITKILARIHDQERLSDEETQ
jgi:hypothetical protein